jgi:hypothetical protein
MSLIGKVSFIRLHELLFQLQSTEYLIPVTKIRYVCENYLVICSGLSELNDCSKLGMGIILIMAVQMILAAKSNG